MRVIALMLRLFGMAGAAHAQLTFTLDPPQGQNGGVVNVRVDDVDGCSHTDGFSTVVRNGNAVTATAWIDDSVPPGGCPPAWMTPQFFPLGTFATGNYTVEIVVCVNAPVPCSVQATLDLSVFGSSGQRFTVPAAGWPVLVLLAVALGVAGVGRRSHSR